MLSALALAGFALAAVAPALFRRLGRRAAAPVVAGPVALVALAAAQAPAVWDGATLVERYPWAPGIGLWLSFRLDGLSLLFVLLVSGLGAVVAAYSAGYLKDNPRLGEFWGLLLFFMAAMLGLVLAGNLLVLFGFWELTSISSFLLIGFEHKHERARRAAWQALLVTAGGGLAMLAGFVMLGQMAGSYEIAVLFERAAQIRAHPLYIPALLLVALGAFTKSAQFPFHFWLPSAMQAPTPVSAYLHSATMVKAGVYLLARLNPVLGGTEIWFWLLVVVGGITALGGAGQAVQRKDLKQLLAYSTISVLGMLTLLIGIGSTAALQAVPVYLLGHALYKAALFMGAGCVDHETGTRNTDALGGLARYMPATAGILIAAAASKAGVAPMFGFIGKEMVYEAAQQARAALWVTGTLFVANALLVAVAVMVSLRILSGKRRGGHPHIHEAPAAMWAGGMIPAALGLLCGLAPALAEPAAAGAWRAIDPLAAGGHLHLALFHGFNLTLLLGTATLAAGAAGYFARGRLRELGERLSPAARFGPASAYAGLLEGTLRFAAWQTRRLQNGKLRFYVMAVVLAALALTGLPLVSQLGSLPPPRIGTFHVHEAAIAAVIVLAALAAVGARSRLQAVAALGAAGLGVSVLFALMGAPDLAMTQLAVETLLVVLLVLVFHHLPDFTARTPPKGRARDASIALAGGALMAALVYVAGSTPNDSIAGYYLENSLKLAGGRNVVNVILTDFRALDTLGEITVLAAAALGVYALLRAPGKETE